MLKANIMYATVRREIFSGNSFLWDVLAPNVAAAVQSGRFVMLRRYDNGERIPLTIADFDRKRGTGMCGPRRVTVGGEVRFACVDGPDFDGRQADFGELAP